MKNQKHYNKIIDWAGRKGFGNIKANIDEFESPVSYASAEKDLTYTPDVTVKKRTKKSYLEIVVKSDDFKQKISKWKLLSTLAAIKGGRFILFAPKGNKAFAQRMIDEYNLNAELVYLPSI